jgi:hypothetical protein
MYVLNPKSQDDSPNLKLMATGHMHGSWFEFTDKEERILSIGLNLGAVNFFTAPMLS